MPDDVTVPGKPAGRLDRLTRPGSLLLIAVMLLALMPMVSSINDPDFWWHLKAGQLITQLHHLVYTDPFTYSVAGHHWIMHEWLSEVMFAALFSLGGLALIVIVLSLVTWIGMLLVLLKAQLDRPLAGVAAAGVLFGSVVGYPIWGPRVQMETFMFICLTLLLAEVHLRRERDRLAWLLVPVYLLWSQLHGGFVAGPAFLLVILVAEFVGRRLGWPDAAPSRRVRSLAIITALATAVTMINPNGPLIILYALGTVGSPAQQALIQEWASPDFHIGLILYLYLPMLLSLAAMIIVNRRIRCRDAALVVASVILSLQSARNIALFVAAATPIWTMQLDMIVRRVIARRRRAAVRRQDVPMPMRVALAAVLLVALLFADGSRIAVAGAPVENSFYYAVNYPVCAARWLAQDKQHLNIFNQYGDGGYLADTLSSQGDKVFIFGDAALMGDPLLYTYQDITNLTPGWDQMLHTDGTQVILFVTDTPFVDLLRHSRDWTLVYQDPHDVIFVRTDQLHSLGLPPPATVPTDPSDPCYQLAHTPASQWPQ